MAKKRNNAKWIILGFLIVALVLFALNFNKIIPSSKHTVEIDPDIYNQFDNGTEWVRVIVHVSPTQYVDSVISSLPSSEFVLKRKWEFFSGEITKNGLDILKNNPYVIKIEFSEPVIFN